MPTSYKVAPDLFLVQQTVSGKAQVKPAAPPPRQPHRHHRLLRQHELGSSQDPRADEEEGPQASGA